ncbi:MAG: hypothetical protein IIA92_11410 [Chloroflexi bacterium]|nr:hypothetical protein [Chloroflexota bacterium]
MSENQPNWSGWIFLDPETIKSQVPNCIGVYRSRVAGDINHLAYIGRTVAEAGLKGRLGGRAGSIKHVLAQNPKHKYQLAPAEKVIISDGKSLEVSYACAQSAEEALTWEARLIHDYREVHGDIPSGNTKNPRLRD